jgi:hypothetical protein
MARCTTFKYDLWSFLPLLIPDLVPPTHTCCFSLTEADTELCPSGSPCSTTAGGEGASGDFLVVVTAKATSSCVTSGGASSTGTLAYASKCFQGSGSVYLDR